MGGWADLKQTTPWGSLPILEIPGGKVLGHELAILDYVATLAPQMAPTPDENLDSQQLMYESEDIYLMLRKVYKSKASPEVVDAFWNLNDPTKRKADQSIA